MTHSVLPTARAATQNDLICAQASVGTYGSTIVHIGGYLCAAHRLVDNAV